MAMLAVKRFMTRQVFAVSADDTIETVIDLLLQYRIAGVPVVDTQRRLVGVITEHDLLRVVYDLHTPKNSVGDYMTTDVVLVEEDTPLTEVADLLLERCLRRVPVVRRGKLVGILSRRDIIRFIRETRLHLGLPLLGQPTVRPAESAIAEPATV